MTDVQLPLPSGRIGPDHDTLRASALANLARHSAHDTVLVSCTLRQPVIAQHHTPSGLATTDIDALSEIVSELGGRQLDLVLHGSGGALDAGSELVSLLRSRYDTIRAVVPNAALAVMSLIVMACDTAVMPETAVLGAGKDPLQPEITPDRAADWVVRNCTLSDSGQRSRIASILFSDDDGPRSPVTAAHAHDLGLAIHLVSERTGIGADIRTLGESIESGHAAATCTTAIANHRGTCYIVEA